MPKTTFFRKDTFAQKTCFPGRFPWRASLEGFPASFLEKSVDQLFELINLINKVNYISRSAFSREMRQKSNPEKHPPENHTFLNMCYQKSVFLASTMFSDGLNMLLSFLAEK